MPQQPVQGAPLAFLPERPGGLTERGEAHRAEAGQNQGSTEFLTWHYNFNASDAELYSFQS